MATDDPLRAKNIGDGCKVNEEWLEIRVYTLFKAQFYKFAQNFNLALKLINTKEAGLFEATTDRFYAAGIGWNSKKWATYSWEGKNVSGTLLAKVRRILRSKHEEGLDLNRLAFNYSLPSLQWDECSRHGELFLDDHLKLQHEGEIAGDEKRNAECSDQLPKRNHVSDKSNSEEIPQADNPSNTQKFSGKEIDKQINELSELLKVMEEDVNEKDTSFYKTMKSWAARRNSHSIPDTGNSVKSRSNPPRGEHSLTLRDRRYLHHQEEDDIEELQLRALGFERSYGKTWPKGSMSASTPNQRQRPARTENSYNKSKYRYENQHERAYKGHSEACHQNNASRLVFQDPSKVHSTTPTGSRGANTSQTKFKTAL